MVDIQDGKKLLAKAFFVQRQVIVCEIIRRKLQSALPRNAISIASSVSTLSVASFKKSPITYYKYGMSTESGLKS